MEKVLYGWSWYYPAILSSKTFGRTININDKNMSFRMIKF